MTAHQDSATAQEDVALRPRQRGGNYSLPKGHCTNRSQWRVPPGKPPERLSPHYQLDCEFGSSLMLIWRNDGTEPIYVCEEHAQELAQELAQKLTPRLERSADACASAHSPIVEASKRGEAAPGETEPAAAAGKTSAASEVSNGASESHRKIAKSPRSPAERRAAFVQTIGELTRQLEGILSESEAAISVAQTIDIPLEHAALEIIDNPAMNETQKDSTVQQLGALQESLKRDISQEMTIVEAHRIKESVGNALNGNSGVAEEAKSGYRAVYDSLDRAIHDAVPKAKHLEERLEHLCKMKVELEDPSQGEG